MEITDFKMDGVIPSVIDERDYTYSMVAEVNTGEEELPKSFRLNYQFEPKNQGNVGSCVAHSIAEMDEIIQAMEKQLSPGFVYANRKNSDWQGSGMCPRDALAQLVKCGICLQELFPVNEPYPGIKDTLAKYDTSAIIADAATRKSLSYISLDLDEVKRYIYKEKKPVLFTVKVYESFYQAKNGVIPQPSGKLIGAHAMTALGWDERGIITLNHWDKWGDKGYVYIPMDYVGFLEFWSVTDKPIIKPITPQPTPTPGPKPTPSPIIKPQNAVLYKVQLGAFKNIDNARALINELTRKGIACCIVTYPGLYKVQLGAFKVKDNATTLLKQVQDLGYKDAFIVTVI